MTTLPLLANPSEAFRQPTLIDFELFHQEADKKGMLDSPLFAYIPSMVERVARLRLIYDRIVAAGHSAEVWLAIAGKEHTWGTAADSVLRRNDTRSWTNAKTIQDPGIAGRRVYDEVRRDWYAAYDDVEDSVRDGIYRIDDPTYAYKDAVSIGEVVQVFAPKEDSNDPEGYAWWIVNYVNGLRSRMVAAAPGGDTPLVPWIPADGRHFTRGRSEPWPYYYIQHHTDGWDSLFWLTESPNSNVSATYLANHDGSLRGQLVRHQDTPHTTGKMNDDSLSMEWERKWSGTTEQREVSLAQYRKLAAAWHLIIQVEYERGNPHLRDAAGNLKLDRDQLRDHNDFYATTCPGNLDMDRLYELVQAEIAGATNPNALIIDGIAVVLGFKDHFLEVGAAVYPEDPVTGGIAHFGKPVAAEYETEFGSAQPFEGYVMEWHRGNNPPFDIIRTLRGQPDPERAA